MRKLLAIIIVAVVLGTGYTVSADATTAQVYQIQRLTGAVRQLRSDLSDSRHEVKRLDALLTIEQAKPVYPTYMDTETANEAFHLYRVSWTEQRGAAAFSFTSDPLYTMDQRNQFVAIVSANPNTIPGSVKIQSTTAYLNWS